MVNRVEKVKSPELCSCGEVINKGENMRIVVGDVYPVVEKGLAGFAVTGRRYCQKCDASLKVKVRKQIRFQKKFAEMEAIKKENK